MFFLIKDFGKYEGTWKPTSLSDWTGMHNAPPIIPTPGKTFYLNGDSISVKEVVMHKDSNGNLYTTSTNSSFTLKYDIQSKLKGQGSSILNVAEHYYGYTDQNVLALHLKYERDIDLNGNIGYKNLNDKFDITENTIYVRYYTWSAYEATIQDRKLVKVH